ncbi:MAG: putative zinc-binding metallopeptidase [Planctomycetaceae bacterium]
MSKRSRLRRWWNLDDEDLLDLRLCDLPVRIEGSWLEQLVGRLQGEMEARGLRFKPHCWLSNEWFSPDGVPGIAIPFYLAHPRLRKLERAQMLDVEGGTRDACLRILRHEAGHAIDVAYGLRRRADWRRQFGSASQRYPTHYRPRPFSRRYVLHLSWWYAQSHPLEDFAETFAVWLRPRSRWRQQYAGWPALSKVEYVEGLMADLAEAPPLVRSRTHVEALPGMRTTLRAHYQAKRRTYGLDIGGVSDRDLRRLFDEEGGREAAAAFLKRHAKELREQVARWTGQHVYTIEQLLEEMTRSCARLRLRRAGGERHARLGAAVLLTARVMAYLHRRGREVSL